jgi:hypothetical protein
MSSVFTTKSDIEMRWCIWQLARFSHCYFRTSRDPWLILSHLFSSSFWMVLGHELQITCLLATCSYLIHASSPQLRNCTQFMCKFCELWQNYKTTKSLPHPRCKVSINPQISLWSFCNPHSLTLWTLMIWRYHFIILLNNLNFYVCIIIHDVVYEGWSFSPFKTFFVTNSVACNRILSLFITE